MSIEYEAVIGLEVHVEIDTQTKVFCGCKNDFHGPPNTHICPVCLGLPGVLPVLNRAMVDASVAVGLALNCEISRWSKMDRKNYFYPDQCKNYQISQYDLPLCKNGYLDIDTDKGIRRVGITRAHMEEDTARNVHTLGVAESGIDFNRSGVPLLEIVTEPDLRDAEETYAFLSELKQLLEYLGVSDCNMEEGSLRAEPNISIRPKGEETLGTKTEVKNIASFSGAQKAVEYEIRRHTQVLKGGGEVVQETRGWDAERGITVSQREKESAHDYRYFPEPDLAPIVVDETWEQRIRESLPELPRARRQRVATDYALSEYDAGVITATRPLADYFEETAKAGAPPKKAANWIMGDLLALLSEAKKDIKDCAIEPRKLSAMILLIEDGTISGKIGKELLPEMFQSGADPKALIEAQGLMQISDVDAIQSIAREVIAENPGPAGDYREGKKKAMGFLVGQMMKATQGKGNPKIINETLASLLEQEGHE